MSHERHASLAAANAYFDGAPRPDAEAVQAGAFVLFVSRSPWNYYARPALEHSQAVTVGDVEVLRAVCRERHVDLALEWVHEIHPELPDIATQCGLRAVRHPLLARGADEHVQAEKAGAAVRVVGADEPALLLARAVAEVSFGTGGTATGPAGTADRDRAAGTVAPELLAHLRNRARRRLTITAVAEIDDEVVAAGSYQPVDDVAEILAVATLPAFRRQGLAASVTAELAQHASENGVRLLVLSAQDDDVARVYQRVGFRPIGSTGSAEQRTR